MLLILCLLHCMQLNSHLIDNLFADDFLTFTHLKHFCMDLFSKALNNIVKWNMIGSARIVCLYASIL